MNGWARCSWAMGALATALSLAGGCSSKPLQDLDATGLGGSGAIDAGEDRPPPPRDAFIDVALDVPTRIDVPPPIDVPPAFDAPPDVSIDAPLFTGVRSFVVTSQIMRDGGIGSFPSSHVFTLVLDGDRRIAIAGGAGEGNAAPLVPLAGGVLQIAGPLSFTTAGTCNGSTIRYEDMRVTIDANGALSGNGRGQLFTVSGDVAFSTSATMSLTGVKDVQPPTLSLSGVAADPFGSFSLVPSEPLPLGVRPVLRVAGGESTELAASTTTTTAVSVVTGFLKPAKVLRYATQYEILIDGITDFAGNPGSAGTSLFTTNALPPLAAEDGFEGVTGTTFAGAQVLSEAGASIITGAKSLYIAPSAAQSVGQPPLALRLALAAGDTVVRFAYRTVSPGSSSSPAFTFGVTWALGSEGGAIGAGSMPSDSGATTPATIGGTAVTLGPITTATFTLPAGAANEVVLQRTVRAPVNCGPPLPYVAGIIIDDARAE